MRPEAKLEDGEVMFRFWPVDLTGESRHEDKMIRAQYHFRPSARGLLSWDVRRLVNLSKDFTVQLVEVSDIKEVDENHWYAYEGQVPTCRSLVEHMKLIDDADFSFPIILDAEGRVMDGMHRVCKAIRQGEFRIAAVQFAVDPEPDYVGRAPKELPYE